MRRRLIKRAYFVAKQEGVLKLFSSLPRLRWRSETYIRLFSEYKKFTHKMIGYENIPAPFLRIEINPNKVKKVLDSPFPHPSAAGSVIGGDWDKKEYSPINNMPKYSAINKVINENKSWNETLLIDHLNQVIEQTGHVKGFTTRNELNKHYLKKVESLIDSISEDGYKSMENFGDNPKERLEDVAVNIGRNGELIFNGGPGRHRISIASALDIEEIPVIVLVRHKKWQQTREYVAQGYDPREVERSHPDLRDI